MNANSFAEYITEIRTQRGFTLRSMARLLEISPSYYNDIEKGRRNPPDLQKLEQFAQITGLNDAERNQMYDLAGKACGRVAPDIAAYLLQRDDVRSALRVARDLQADQNGWERFVSEIRNRHKPT